MRRLLTAVIACVLGVVAVAGSATIVMAQDEPYDHEWRIEGLYGGETGATRSSTIADQMRLAYRAGRWSGAITYRDVLGIQDAGGTTQSQESSIALTLTGGAAQGGSALSGRFTGVAELRSAPAANLDDAMRANGSGTATTYDLYGFWAADLDGNVANGYLVYQAAQPRPGSVGPQYDADWFNRAPEGGVDATGEPQPFSVVVDGAVPVEPGAARGFGAPDKKTAEKRGFIDYVIRGLRGVKMELPAPVSSAQSLAAERLHDSRPEGAFELPLTAVTIDLDVAGAVLDAKNRATGLLGDGGPSGALGREGLQAGAELTASAPQSPQFESASAASNAFKARLLPLLEAQKATGTEQLLTDVKVVPSRVDSDTAEQMRAWLSAVEALAMPPENGDGLIAAARRAGVAVARTPIPQDGRLAAAILAAGDSPAAPADAIDIARFDREQDADTGDVGAILSASANGDAAAIARVLASSDASGAIVWAGGTRREAPEAWLGYRRGDGARYWLAGEMGDIALTDATVRGWVWRTPHTAIVDAARVGRVLELLGSQR